MKEKIEQIKDEEVQGIEVIDLGDAAVETRQQSPFPWFPDSCCAYAYAGK